jgi:hypothetical protein
MSTGRHLPISAPACVCVDADVLGVDTPAASYPEGSVTAIAKVLAVPLFAYDVERLIGISCGPSEAQAVADALYADEREGPFHL